MWQSYAFKVAIVSPLTPTGKKHTKSLEIEGGNRLEKNDSAARKHTKSSDSNGGNRLEVALAAFKQAPWKQRFAPAPCARRGSVAALLKMASHGDVKAAAPPLHVLDTFTNEGPRQAHGGAAETAKVVLAAFPL